MGIESTLICKSLQKEELRDEAVIDVHRCIAGVAIHVYVIVALDGKRTVLPSMEKYGGRFVARGGPIHVLEGEWPRERLIIAEFPSMERAQQWWGSPEYAEPKALRQATAEARQNRLRL
jgi:uncharacterized protein (DUF1330 family)